MCEHLAQQWSLTEYCPRGTFSRLEKSWNSYFTFHSIHFPSFCEKGVLGCLMKWLALAQFRESCHPSSLPLSKQAVCLRMACYTASYTQTHAWSGTKWDKLSAYNDLGLQLNTNIHVFVHTKRRKNTITILSANWIFKTKSERSPDLWIL